MVENSKERDFTKEKHFVKYFVLKTRRKLAIDK